MHHGAGLRTLTGHDEPARTLALGGDPPDLRAADRAMLEYARKLTRAPAEVGPGDVASLRDAGFDDRAVLDICQIACYYNYVNRLADGLGVELEDFWTEDMMIVSREEFEGGRT